MKPILRAGMALLPICAGVVIWLTLLEAERPASLPSGDAGNRVARPGAEAGADNKSGAAADLRRRYAALQDRMDATLEKEALALEWVKSLRRADCELLLTEWKSGRLPWPGEPLGPLLFGEIGRKMGRSVLADLKTRKLSPETRLAMRCLLTGVVSSAPGKTCAQLASVRDRELRRILAEAVWEFSKLQSFDDALHLLVSACPHLLSPDPGAGERSAARSMPGDLEKLSHQIAAQWLPNGPVAENLDKLQTLLRSALPAALKADLTKNCLRQSLRRAPVEALQYLEGFGDLEISDSDRSSLWHYAAASAAPAELKAVKSSLEQRYAGGDASVETSFQTIGRRLGGLDPAGAAALIGQTTNETVADQLKYGLVVAVRKEDPEAAEAWRATIRDEHLRNMSRD